MVKQINFNEPEKSVSAPSVGKRQVAALASDGKSKADSQRRWATREVQALEYLGLSGQDAGEQEEPL